MKEQMTMKNEMMAKMNAVVIPVINENEQYVFTMRNIKGEHVSVEEAWVAMGSNVSSIIDVRTMLGGIVDSMVEDKTSFNSFKIETRKAITEEDKDSTLYYKYNVQYHNEYASITIPEIKVVSKNDYDIAKVMTEIHDILVKANLS